AFQHLARIALAALALVALVAGAAYSVNNRRLPSPVSPSQDLPHRMRRFLVRVSERWIVRRPLTRAGFFFTLQTLSRSGAHRLTMAIAIAIGLAFATMALQSINVQNTLGNPQMMTGLLAIQPTVVLVLLIALQ